MATQASWWDINKARESIDWLNAGSSNDFSNKAERHELFEAVINTGCKSWHCQKKEKARFVLSIYTHDDQKLVKSLVWHAITMVTVLNIIIL